MSPKPLRDQRGQTSADYVGALTLVIVLAIALSLIVSPIGEAALNGTSRGICRVIEAAGLGGGGCGSGLEQATSDPYEPSKCLVFSGESKVSGAVTMFSVRVGADAGYVLEAKSDRKWYLTVKGGVSAGGEGAFGASGESKSAKAGAGGSGSAYAAVRGEGSATYRFDSKAEADAELARIRKDLAAAPVRAAEGYAEGTNWDPPGPIPGVRVPFGGLIGAIREAVRPEHELPPRYETSFAVGSEGGLAGAAGDGAYVSGKAADSNMVGVKLSQDDTGRNTRTVIFKINREAEAAAGVPFSAGFSGTSVGEGEVAITYTETGSGWSATDLEVKTAVGLSGGVSFGAEVKDLRGLRQSLKEVAISGSDEVGLAGVLTATYDLTDPRTRAAMAGALKSVGVPVMNGRLPDPGDVGSSLQDAFDTYDDVSFVTYDTSKTSLGGGFKVGDLIAFGAEGSYTRKESELRNAQYLTPSGWRDWISCTG